MRTAVYIESGVTQLVLTPETEFEQSLLREIREGAPMSTRLVSGEFYRTGGGWIRSGLSPFEGGSAPKSLMVIIEKGPDEPPRAG